MAGLQWPGRSAKEEEDCLTNISRAGSRQISKTRIYDDFISSGH